jgi:hypothetical protein
MYKSVSVKGLSVETVVRQSNCVFQRFCPFVAIENIHDNVQVHINIREDYKMYMGKMYFTLVM